MPTRNASAKWEGGLKGGKGSFSGQTGLGGQYNFSSRFENGQGSNPEELLAAAEAACFSMALSAGLEGNGTPPTSVETKAACTIEKVGDGFSITKMALDVTADGAEHRRRDVSEDRGGDEGRLSGVEGAEGNSGDHAERQAGVMHEIECRISRLESRYPTSDQE